jgi:hypothetical protein
MTKRTSEPGQHYCDIQPGIFGRAAASDWIVEDVQTDPYGLRHAHLISVTDPTVRKTLAAEVLAGRQTAGPRAGHLLGTPPVLNQVKARQSMDQRFFCRNCCDG